MKEHSSKEYQRARLNFKNLRSGVVVRFWNLAKRLDQGHRKDKKKR